MIIKQIRYYDEGYEGNLSSKSKKELNQPSDITAEKLISGDYFKEIKCKEIQIKTYPGTRLTINNESIYIGEVGVYNILYRENMIINSLTVDRDSIEYIKNDPREYFVITFILDEEEEAENENTDSNDETIIPDEGSEINPDDDIPSGDSEDKKEVKNNHDKPRRH